MEPLETQPEVAVRRFALAVLLAGASVMPAAAADIRLTLGPLDHRYGDIPTQWVTVRNAGGQPLRAVWVECTFFAGARPVTSGANRTTAGLAPGQHQTIEVGGSPPAPATRAECAAREGAM
ncbi:hypothetical protein STVA_41690 [Allostella vacuolata]|nr:hypothetical protein STVA_41690 [Stella vacuolata]